MVLTRKMDSEKPIKIEPSTREMEPAMRHAPRGGQPSQGRRLSLYGSDEEKESEGAASATNSAQEYSTPPPSDAEASKAVGKARATKPRQTQQAARLLPKQTACLHP